MWLTELPDFFTLLIDRITSRFNALAQVISEAEHSCSLWGPMESPRSSLFGCHQ